MTAAKAGEGNLKRHRLTFHLVHKTMERAFDKETASSLPILLKGYLWLKKVSGGHFKKNSHSFLFSASFKVVSNALNYFF